MRGEGRDLVTGHGLEPRRSSLARAAFLDRDGVINLDKGYVSRLSDFEFAPGIVSALWRLHRAGYLLVVVTNQSGIARGMFTDADYHELEEAVTAELARSGIPIAATYHCPHHPMASVEAYRMECSCRKPQPGMLLQAIGELAIAPQESVLFGDKLSDIMAGRSAKIGKCYLIGDPGEKEPSNALADGAFPTLLDATTALFPAR